MGWELPPSTNGFKDVRPKRRRLSGFVPMLVLVVITTVPVPGAKAAPHDSQMIAPAARAWPSPRWRW